MLGHRLRRWPNIKTTLIQHILFVERPPSVIIMIICHGYNVEATLRKHWIHRVCWGKAGPMTDAGHGTPTAIFCLLSLTQVLSFPQSIERFAGAKNRASYWIYHLSRLLCVFLFRADSGSDTSTCREVTCSIVQMYHWRKERNGYLLEDNDPVTVNL